MFYVLSRFLACLASPVLYIVIWAIAAAFFKRRIIRFSLAAISFILLLIFTNSAIYYSAMRSWCSCCNFEIDTTAHYKYLLIPGGFAGYDSLHHVIEYGDPVDRIVYASELYKAGIVEKIIISGDATNATSEAETVFKTQMQRLCGIPAADFIMEPNARNTFENIELTKAMLADSLQGKKVLIVNSAVYMRRTMLCCELADFQADFLTCDYKDYVIPELWQRHIPEFHMLDSWMRLIHEWIGYAAYNLNY